MDGVGQDQPENTDLIIYMMIKERQTTNFRAKVFHMRSSIIENIILNFEKVKGI